MDLYNPLKLPEQAVGYLSEEFRLELVLPEADGGGWPERYAAEGYERIPVTGILTDRTVLTAAISRLAGILKAGSEAPAASLFAKAYGRILVGALYAVSMHDAGLGLAPEQTVLLLHPERGELRLVADAAACTALPSGCDRREWRDGLLRLLYAEHLQRLLSLLADIYKVQKAALWENSLVYILHYYRIWEDAVRNDAARLGLVQDDFRRLTGALKAADAADIFGEPTGNPFAVEGRNIPHPIQAGGTLRIRKTCCLKSQTAGGRACTVCPCIDEHTRASLFAKG